MNILAVGDKKVAKFVIKKQENVLFEFLSNSTGSFFRFFYSPFVPVSMITLSEFVLIRHSEAELQVNCNLFS